MSTWKDAAGRKEGTAGYRFGDLSRSLVNKMSGTAAEEVEEAEAARHPLTEYGLTSRRVSRYGWRRDLPDHRDLWADISHLFGALPAEVDLRPKCPAVYDQGALGSCTAHAISAAVSFDARREHLVEFAPSRLFIYYNERALEGSVANDAGASLRDGVKVVHKLGVCAEDLWPYDCAKFAEMPPVEAYGAAKAHAARRYYRVPQHLGHLKGCLAAGFPFVFGFVVLSSFETPDVSQTGKMPMPQAEDKQLGGHAVCCVGYSDADECFIVRNSWGADWGQAGYFRMPYAYALNAGLADDFWTIRWVT
ncbi:hypothetical protein M885DRAFT_537505 [Pelagophyceae sp. CCMP2097]|nr:hypothetical protein M885DRAFT_537505 [Pelagophyceae sp. CCMP2097]|mmetsp:Transcript_2646/g.9667  ORF Transcript_2646/g.9667 Transcript_2646/m.9667 type:complete len:306 (+) Transcript_2646:358-1275(+)